MAKTGPARKPGDRYPSGKLKRPARYAGVAPAEIQRTIALARSKACDPVLGTCIGWLRLHEIITGVQMAAAVSYATLRGRYHRVMGFPSRSAASPSYEQGYGFNVDAGADDDEVRREARVRRLLEDHEAMLASLSAPVVGFLDRVCIDNEMPGSWEFALLGGSLLIIAKHFRMVS